MAQTSPNPLFSTLKRRWKIIKSYIGWEDYLALIAIVIGALGYVPGPIPFVEGWTDFYHDIRSDLIALGITVLIIDNVNEMYRRRAEKERLILQMGSPDHGFAIEAARQLRVREWLFDGSLGWANLYKANLSDADLSGASMRVAYLDGADLTRAILNGATLNGSDLTEASLYKADLIGASLYKTHLTNADLTEADLSYANLIKADLTGTRLTRARYNNKTEWPNGFDPVAAGAIEDQASK